MMVANARHKRDKSTMEAWALGKSVDRKQRQMQDINAAQMDNGGGQQIQVNLVLQAVPPAGHWMSPPCMFSCLLKSQCNANYCLFCKDCKRWNLMPQKCKPAMHHKAPWKESKCSCIVKFNASNEQWAMSAYPSVKHDTVQVQVLILVDNVEESGRGRWSLVNTSTPPATYFEAWYRGFQ